jgi:predicted ATPase
MYLDKVYIDNTLFPTRRHYPFNLPVLAEPVELTFRELIAFFVGENGSGKSTVLDAIARKSGISVWDLPHRHVAHHNPFEHRLMDFVTTKWTNGTMTGSLFQAETFRDLADFLDDVALCDPGRLQYQGGQILNTLSRGEGILSYLGSRLQVQGIYFLDEPESALSPASQVHFLQLLQKFQATGRAQFIIATHSPILMACPKAQIFCFDATRIQEVSYQETTHYQIYQQFFKNPAMFVNS